MAQTTSSPVQWYLQPTILTLTGVAAAYSFYHLYISSIRIPSSTLHRSNAVHQPRRRHLSSQADMSGDAPVSIPADLTLQEHEALDPAETEESVEMAGIDAPNHSIRGLLYYVAEENAIRRAYIHRGIRCEACGEFPILGVRFHCLNCPDFDLCATCEAHATHPKNHVFAKIKIPLSLLSQPPKPLKLWYAGDPQKLHDSLDMALKKELSEDSGFDETELDALYDQFTCIANVPWYSDPSRIGAAIDRRAFNKTMSSDRWTNSFAPNVLLDRMFAFYDTDRNSLIGFKEFVDGMKYLRGSKRFASLQRALQGFDIAGDTYVSRADFVRMLRAKFEIQKQLITDATESVEAERTQAAVGVLRSSQPISSVFNGEEIPAGQDRRFHGKQLDANGDIAPIGNDKIIIEDDEPFSRTTTKTGTERLRTALDRFEDLLRGVERTDAADSMDGSSDVESAIRVSLVDRLTSSTETEPFVQDLLWHYKEEGFHALLDPLFSTREELEDRAIATRDARKRWRAAIDRFSNEQEVAKHAVRAEIGAEDGTERLVARGIVPTDHESLEQLGMKTTSAPLEVLLEVSGYSIRDEPDEPSLQSTATNDESGSRRTTIPSPLREVSSIDDGRDATQSLNPGAKVEDDEHEESPPKEILQFWMRLDIVDREIEEKGGYGRLSLAEVERVVVEEGLHEVRGLIKSWLEWAAF